MYSQNNRGWGGSHRDDYRNRDNYSNNPYNRNDRDNYSRDDSSWYSRHSDDYRGNSRYNNDSDIYEREYDNSDRRNYYDGRRNFTNSNNGDRYGRQSSSSYGWHGKDMNDDNYSSSDYERRDPHDNFNNTGYRSNDYREHRGDDRNFFERAGDRIRERWNDMMDNDDNYETENRYRGGYNSNDYRHRNRYEESEAY